MDSGWRGLPPRAGVSYKPRHLEELLASRGPVAWVEIHAENYMVDGGPAIAGLKRLAARFPVSCHGVGLSIGSEGPLDTEHLDRLAHLVSWLDPASVSEHLAWSGHGGGYLADLLPVPCDEATLGRVSDHIDEVQERLGRRILLENPSNYLGFSSSTMAEVEFLGAIAGRTGCGLLLDVNNVHVSAVNGAYEAEAYLDAFPLALVGEIHLAGHEVEADENGRPLLIDAHNNPVADPVWALFERVCARVGPVPTLIEWDNDVPEWPVLAADAARADAVLAKCRA
ncbi:MAG: DUF692 domain-containing protein [Alphaproteobacteria bacterium]|nr:DUF692 domain-containing protein [Alphaproteobacteria bacterium]